MSDTSGTHDGISKVPILYLLGGELISLELPASTAELLSGNQLDLSVTSPSITYFMSEAPLDIEVLPPTLSSFSYGTYGAFAGSVPHPVAFGLSKSTSGTVSITIPLTVLQGSSFSSFGALNNSVLTPTLLLDSLSNFGATTLSLPAPLLQALSLSTTGSANLIVVKSIIDISAKEGTGGVFGVSVVKPQLLISQNKNTSGAVIINPVSLVVDINELANDYVCLIVNTDSLGLSEYTNFNFTAFAQIDDKTFGLHKNGSIYVLGGTSDVGTAITGIVETGADDFKDSRLKRLLSLVVGVKALGDLKYRAKRWDGYGQYIPIVTTRSGEVETRKCMTEKVPFSRTFGVEISGEQFSVEHVELVTRETVRRSGGM